MPSPIQIPADIVINESSAEASARRYAQKFNDALRLNSQNFTQPLGKITGNVADFEKSLAASTSRVLAFGASAGVLLGLERAFSSLIRTTISVEKSLTDINVIANLSQTSLKQFGDSLFSVARNTGQSFNEVAKAATEFARQGLGVTETLKRTRDALILTRLTGLDAASAVTDLTAAMNSFNKSALDSTQIINKLA